MTPHVFATWRMGLALLLVVASAVHAQSQAPASALGQGEHQVATTDAKSAPSPAVTNATDAGTTEATRWLRLIDGGKYAEGWTQAATAFRAAIGQPDWDKTLVQVRTPLGAATTRTLKSAALTHQLPNVPPGDYVVIQFDTAFEQRPAAVETVVVQRDTDQVWRVSGYFIK
jgi:Protein of unknown function (DUF4019)